MASMNIIETLVLSAGHVSWFATPENEWESLIFKHIPRWLAAMDNDVLHGFYFGDSSIYTKAHLSVWLRLFAFWAIFMLVLILTMLCSNVIIRRQWTETERLSYPVIQLPDEITKTDGTIFQNALFRIGFLLTVAINILNGFHFYFPVIPQFRIRIPDIGHFFTIEPWNAVGWMPLVVYPWLVGMIFFIPLDLSFSCWFFYWLMKGLKVMGSASGWRTLPQFPYSRHQSFGAYMGIFVFVLFAGRRHFINALITAYRSVDRESGDPISMRVAFIYVVLGGVFLIGFAVSAGMSAWVALAFFTLYFMLSVGLARIRAELGAPVHDLHFMGPQRLVVFATGTRLIGNQNLTLLAIFSWFNRAYRCHPMPIQLESLKLAQVQRFHTRRIFFALIIGCAIGAITVWWKLLDAFYQQGGSQGIASYAVSAFGREPYTLLENWLTYPDPPDVPALIAVAIGFCLTLVMLILRARLIWWHFHPLGYTLADDYAINWIWSSVLCGWALKLLVLKLGGIRVYRTALPFFIGLILGEFVLGSFWSLLSMVIGQPMYAFKNW